MSNSKQEPILKLNEKYVPITFFNHERKPFEKLPIMVYCTKKVCRFLEVKNSSKSKLLTTLNVAMENDQEGNQSDREMPSDEENENNSNTAHEDDNETLETDEQSALEIAEFSKCMKAIIDRYLSQNDKTASEPENS